MLMMNTCRLYKTSAIVTVLIALGREDTFLKLRQELGGR